MPSRSRSLAQWLLFLVLAVGLGGCAGLSGLSRASDPKDQLAAPATAPNPAPAAGGETAKSAELAAASAEPPALPARPLEIVLATDPDQMKLAQKTSGRPPGGDEMEEYDPWEPFNEKMFDFNRGLDRWIIKPVAKGYNKVMPDPWQEAVSNGFKNIGFVPRFVNCMLQGRFAGAGREILRFIVNSTIGLGGLMDIAGHEGFKPCKGDTGQTLGAWGIGPGPYLVLPFFPPLTVRDAVGYVVDGAMDPLSYFIPFPTAQLPMKAGDTLNDRSVNLDLYQGFEESTVEFYSALRNAYLQRRLKLIDEAKEGK